MKILDNAVRIIFFALVSILVIEVLFVPFLNNENLGSALQRWFNPKDSRQTIHHLPEQKRRFLAMKREIEARPEVIRRKLKENREQSRILMTQSQARQKDLNRLAEDLKDNQRIGSDRMKNDPKGSLISNDLK